MPINYKQYASNWKSELVPFVLARANHQCEQCHVHQYALRRFVNGIAEPICGNLYLDHMGLYGCDTYREALEAKTALNALQDSNEPKWTIAVLTVSHRDQDIGNNSLSNLQCLCARCHLQYDDVQHRRNVRLTAEKKKGLKRFF